MERVIVSKIRFKCTDGLSFPCKRVLRTHLWANGIPVLLGEHGDSPTGEERGDFRGDLRGVVGRNRAYLGDEEESLLSSMPLSTPLSRH